MNRRNQVRWVGQIVGVRRHVRPALAPARPARVGSGSVVVSTTGQVVDAGEDEAGREDDRAGDHGRGEDVGTLGVGGLGVGGEVGGPAEPVADLVKQALDLGAQPGGEGVDVGWHGRRISVRAIHWMSSDGGTPRAISTAA